MAEKIKIKPPYAYTITEALKLGMTFEMIDEAIGCKPGWSKEFYCDYLDICEQIQGHREVFGYVPNVCKSSKLS